MNNPQEQPDKGAANDLSYLYNFICECPNPRITQAIKKLVDHWLKKTTIVPELASAIRDQLQATNEEVVEICWLLAINPNTPPSVLNDLSIDADSSMLERIAENSNTGAETLAQLSYQAVAEIRIATASNPTTPLASIMMLVTDENPDVRFSIAENPKVPQEALQALANDDNPYVKMRATTTLSRLEVERNVFRQPSVLQ
ncbi:MAG: HEAT repeat domain-containing protein [Candidatus Obscuribacterales bacterium]|nr:HEAT repeat domain-containing protein [Candidatus Obscuribacterales bacterium]